MTFRCLPGSPSCLFAAFLALMMPVAAAGDVVIPGLLNGQPRTKAEKLFQDGIAALGRNELAQAETAFRESLKLDGKAAAPYMGLAQVAIRRGQKAEIELNMKKALELAPDTASIQTSWGTYLYSERELPEAEAALRKATRLDPNLAVAHVQLGDLYMAGFNKPDEAIKEYRAALAVEPTNPGANYALGLALASKQNLSEAESVLSQAAKLAPRNPLPQMALGRVYAEQGKLDRALVAYDNAIAILPKFGAAHIERGNMLAAKGDDTGALKAYEEGQKNDPRRSIGYTNIGMVHQRRQDWDAAEKAYLSAVSVDPRNALVYNNLAWMAADRKVNLTKALEWAKKAVNLAPKVPEFQGTLAWVYRAMGDLPKAEQTLRAAAAMTPPHAVVIYTLGRLYLEQGKKDQASAEFKKALAIDPNFSEAKQRLKELGQG